MTSLLLCAAIGAAAVALLARRRRQRSRLVRELSVEDAGFVHDIARFDEIDRWLPRRCSCGGAMERVGEGPQDDELWRVLVACRGCDRRVATVFRVAH